jgi:hypothetical protein
MREKAIEREIISIASRMNQHQQRSSKQTGKLTYVRGKGDLDLDRAKNIGPSPSSSKRGRQKTFTKNHLFLW